MSMEAEHNHHKDEEEPQLLSGDYDVYGDENTGTGCFDAHTIIAY